MAWASKVLPVPVSPSKTTGTSDFAASAAKRRQRAMASLVVARSSTLRLEGAGRIFRRTRNLVANIFAQLPNWLERVLDQSAPANDDSGLSAHTNARLHFAFLFFVFFQRSQTHKVRSIRRGDRRRTNPVELGIDRAVALIWKSSEEKADLLTDGEFGQPGFAEQQACVWLGIEARKL